MGLSVAMPLHLRLDPKAARDGLDHLDRAVRAACGRAAEGAAEALAGRGDYLSLELTATRFSWRGPGLAEVDQVSRAAAEAVIDSAIRASVAAALDRPASRNVPEPLRDGEGAVPDPDRLLAGAYLAPSYDTTGEKPKDQIVFVLNREGFERQFEVGYVGELYRFKDAASLDQAFRAVLKSLRCRPCNSATAARCM